MARADALYGNLGMLMNIYAPAAGRGKIAGFFDLELLVSPRGLRGRWRHDPPVNPPPP